MKHSNIFLAFLTLHCSCLIASQGAFAQAGALDSTFNPGTGSNNNIHAIALQNDGRIIIGGGFSEYNGTERNRIARLNADGTLDAAFAPGTSADSDVSAIALQSNGGIIVGGAHVTYNEGARNKIVRLNADGTLDDAFNFDSGPETNDWVGAIAIQSDGKIIIGGGFTYNGATIKCVARLNANGMLDEAFDPGTGANNAIRAIALQADGRIIIGGDFTSYNGIARKRIARINADGTLDAAFNPGTGASNNVYAIAIQSDGKIVVGGSFISFNGIARNNVARLNTDGSVDATFDPGIGESDYVRAITLQSDGKIMIGGLFDSYNGIAIRSIARLNNDGTLDPSFDPDTGINLGVSAIVLQNDGKMLLGGSFSLYNGTTRNRIARVIGDDVNGLDMDGSASPEAFRLYPNPNNGQFTIEGKNADHTIEIHNGLGQLLLRQRATQQSTQLNLHQMPNGIYHISVYAAGEVSRFKVIVEKT